jgi:hypothetical protein
MKSKIKLGILLILILAMFGFFYSRYFYQPKAGRADLSWSKSDDLSVKGYKVYWGTEKRKSDCPPGGYAGSKDVGIATNYAVDKLANGRTYYFSVTSYNEAKKESCFSEETRKDIDVSSWEQLKNFLTGWQK